MTEEKKSALSPAPAESVKAGELLVIAEALPGIDVQKVREWHQRLWQAEKLLSGDVSEVDATPSEAATSPPETALTTELLTATIDLKFWEFVAGLSAEEKARLTIAIKTNQPFLPFTTFLTNFLSQSRAA